MESEELDAVRADTAVASSSADTSDPGPIEEVSLSVSEVVPQSEAWGTGDDEDGWMPKPARLHSGRTRSCAVCFTPLQYTSATSWDEFLQSEEYLRQLQANVLQDAFISSLICGENTAGDLPTEHRMHKNRKLKCRQSVTDYRNMTSAGVVDKSGTEKGSIRTLEEMLIEALPTPVFTHVLERRLAVISHSTNIACERMSHDGVKKIPRPVETAPGNEELHHLAIHTLGALLGAFDYTNPQALKTFEELSQLLTCFPVLSLFSFWSPTKKPPDKVLLLDKEEVEATSVTSSSDSHGAYGAVDGVDNTFWQSQPRPGVVSFVVKSTELEKVTSIVIHWHLKFVPQTVGVQYRPEGSDSFIQLVQDRSVSLSGPTRIETRIPPSCQEARIVMAGTPASNRSGTLWMLRGYNGNLYARGHKLSRTIGKVHPGDIVQVDVDMGEGTLAYKINGTDYGVVFTDLAGHEVHPAVSFYGSGKVITLLGVTKWDCASSGPADIDPVFLSSMREHHFSVGYGTLGKGSQLGYASNGDSNTLSVNAATGSTSIHINGEAKQRCLSTHPPSHGDAYVIYDLSEAYHMIRGAVAINDDTRNEILQNRGVSLVFKIVGDDKMLWQSKQMSETHQMEPFEVNVNNVRMLELKVSCSGSNHCAHAVWKWYSRQEPAICGCGDLSSANLESIGRHDVKDPATELGVSSELVADLRQELEAIARIREESEAPDGSLIEDIDKAAAQTIVAEGSQLLIAQVTVGGSSKKDALGYALEMLPSPARITQGKLYRLTTQEFANGGDPWYKKENLPDEEYDESFIKILRDCYASGSVGFPGSQNMIGAAYGVPTFLSGIVSKLSSYETFMGETPTSIGWMPSIGAVWVKGKRYDYGPKLSVAAGDIFTVVIDYDSQLLSFAYNGKNIGVAVGPQEFQPLGTTIEGLPEVVTAGVSLYGAQDIVQVRPSGIAKSTLCIHWLFDLHNSLASLAVEASLRVVLAKINPPCVGVMHYKSNMLAIRQMKTLLEPEPWLKMLKTILFCGSVALEDG
ncbi:hypothetical protein JG688_00002286 [Phytophthora aleatoria]|uniref:Glycosyl hydrolase family 98 putative carbohydrate-binding module domain-containing protein n=1 Tax=Phytophthora aleatoria TaxID=2496075 RepID=A0A8J5J5U6_9STRA|nr:hypothetical protein JG688_00002286 [Phytophthora aleatoria]